MNIWIDLANSPHVVFFLPLKKILEERGHNITFTLCDFAQTVPLAEKFGLHGPVISCHGGKHKAAKVVNLIRRSLLLRRYMRDRNIDIAVSHNSYAQILAARLLKLRCVTIMDYEGQPANHLAFRLAHKVIVPDCFPEVALRKFGVYNGRLTKYPGFKEQVYLSSFQPESKFADELTAACSIGSSVDLQKQILVTVRTPATMAAYHPMANPLFDKLLKVLHETENATVVVLPRTDAQKIALQKEFPRLQIPDKALEGNSLVYHSDLVISAGGTMNREAAILGTPAYTIFAGAIPAVDRELISMGRMTALQTEDDLSKLKIRKKKPGNALINPQLVHRIADEISTCGNKKN